MKHLRYLAYVLRHKWFVLLECARRGILSRGLLHDLSKFSPSEWGPYVDHFYGRRLGRQRDATGYYKPTDTGDFAFDNAWLHHAHRNDHHWQYWVQADEPGTEPRVHPMAGYALIEMVCDWVGAARAQRSQATVGEWYAANGHKMLLHPNTRTHVEFILDELTGNTHGQ